MKLLETNRLILRDWNEQDLNDLFIILSNPNVALPADSSPITTLCKCKNILDYLIDMKNNYAIELKSTGHIIGTIGLNEDAKRNTDTRNLGFSLAEEFWNQGIMTEALTVVIANAKSITKKLSATHKHINMFFQKFFVFATLFQSKSQHFRPCIRRYWSM